jgi:beta-lactam-binding protein with PASTA domain
MSNTICPQCGTVQPDGGDFCASPVCRAYLAWDTPSEPRKVPPRAPKKRPAAPEKASAVIALPEQDAQVKPLEVNAGEQVAVKALVRNQSEIVDSFLLAVEGFGGEKWWTVEPGEVHLLPLDTGERYEEEVSVLLHPPHTPDASARCWPIEITATSVAREALAASASTSVEIAEFDEIALDVYSPPGASHRASTFQLRLANRSNHLVTIAVSGSEEKNKCRVSIAEPSPALGPGRFRLINVTVRPCERLLVGRAIDHKLEFTAQILTTIDPNSSAAHETTLDLGRPDFGSAEIGSTKPTGIERPVTAPEDGDKPGTCTTTYTQRSWLPWWTPMVLAGALAVALALLAYWVKLRSERVAVPNVRGHYISEARAELEAAGLKGRERLRETTLTSVPSGKPNHANATVGVGDVYYEVPEIGTKLAPGSEVTLYTAVRPNPNPGVVPDLYDLTVKAAENRLTSTGFAIGDIEPYPPPAGQLVLEQTPQAGARALRSRYVVDVKLGQLAAVPDIFDQPPATAAQKLSAVNLVIGTVLPRNPRPSEVVAVQNPPANLIVQAGDTVNVTLGEVVPKLVGLTLAKARAQLAAAGFKRFTVSPSIAPSTDVIVSQSPAANSIVPESGRVLLVATRPPAHAKTKRKQAKSNSKTATNPATNTAKTGTSSPTGGNSTAGTSSTRGTSGEAAAGLPPGTSPTTVGGVAAPTQNAGPSSSFTPGLKPERCSGQHIGQTRCPVAPRQWTP